MVGKRNVCVLNACYMCIGAAAGTGCMQYQRRVQAVCNITAPYVCCYIYEMLSCAVLVPYNRRGRWMSRNEYRDAFIRKSS